jgi:hypothetical protein
MLIPIHFFRALIQLSEMFPLQENDREKQVIENPSLLIRDKKASAVWELSVGKTSHFCSYRVQLFNEKKNTTSFFFVVSFQTSFSLAHTHSLALFLCFFLSVFVCLCVCVCVCVVVLLSERYREVFSQDKTIQP